MYTKVFTALILLMVVKEALRLERAVMPAFGIAITTYDGRVASKQSRMINEFNSVRYGTRTRLLYHSLTRNVL
jgi:hypothetical protein